MKTVVITSVRDARRAHEHFTRLKGRSYATLETRSGKLEFYKPPQSFANGPGNLLATFDPARQTLTFKEA